MCSAGTTERLKKWSEMLFYHKIKNVIVNANMCAGIGFLRKTL